MRVSFKITSKPIIIAATAGVAVLGMSGYVWKEEHRDKVLDVYIFNLSSGRSIFIRTPDDYRVLIDGGGNSDVVREITKYIPFYSRRIDAVIATNTEGKNVSGLIDVLDRYHVDHIYVPSISVGALGLASSTDPIWTAFIQRMSQSRAKVHDIVAGNVLLLGNSVTAKIHFPVLPGDFLYSRASAPEVLFTLNFKQNSITFLGDASHKVQEFLAATSTHLQAADVLVVSHSALPTNISSKLMNELSPTYLIFAKQPTTVKPSSKLKKSLVDPLASIPLENRLNIKEKNTIHLVSDGQKLSIK